MPTYRLPALLVLLVVSVTLVCSIRINKQVRRLVTIGSALGFGVHGGIHSGCPGCGVCSGHIVSPSFVLQSADTTSPCGCSLCLGSVAHAANLPSSNGASSALQGTEAALIKIKVMNEAAVNAQEAVRKGREDLDTVASSLRRLPLEEKAFKRLFDEYSQGVSYKQRYLDKNAFLVYYSGGFDGPNRASIESEDPKELLQKAQYGFRNDAWVALDEARSEIEYLADQGGGPGTGTTDLRDLRKALAQLTEAFKQYLALSG
jgi:hypothetical protein